MATADQISRLRVLIDDPAGTTQTYDDTALSALIDQAGGDLDVAASEAWQEKAASYSRLVDVTESGSSRKMGDLYKNALQMSKHYSDKVTAAAAPVSSTRARVRPIVRP